MNLHTLPAQILTKVTPASLWELLQLHWCGSFVQLYILAIVIFIIGMVNIMVADIVNLH